MFFCLAKNMGNRIFVKGTGFSSFAKNMGRNLGKNVKKKLNW